MFWEGTKVEMWQGPPHINKVKQYETVLSFQVSSFIQFIQPWKQKDFVYLVCFGIKKTTKIFLLFHKTT